MTLISIIVPVYGVEPFVERCVRALMEQTQQEGVEYIFVDDASPDRSMEIVRRTVEEYPERSEQVKILTHRQNRGLPAARNTGLEAASGEYVMHIDSDDYCEPQMLTAMLEKAMETDADMVWCDWYLTGENSERQMHMPDYATAVDATKAMLGGAMKYNVWNKMTRRRIFTDNSLRFPDGQPMGEDMTMIMAAACCRKTAHVNKPLYHYRRTNAGAMTQAYSDRNLEQLRSNVDRISDFIATKRPDLTPELDFFKLQAKFPFLLMKPHKRGFRLWKEWWPEANRSISNNLHMTCHSRIAQRLAAMEFWPLVKVYASLIRIYQRV